MFHKILGGVLILCPFITITALMVMSDGWLLALKVWVIVGGLFLSVLGPGIGVHLILRK